MHSCKDIKYAYAKISTKSFHNKTQRSMSKGSSLLTIVKAILHTTYVPCLHITSKGDSMDKN